jgi:ubiquinone/menaquinone biosynthesis C-methylase UbiE
MSPSGEPPIAPGWLLDELTTAGRENLDAGHVSRYDTKEDADASAEVALLESLGVDHDSVVIDLGAGTGQFALAIAAVCAQVIAVDVSPVMLRQLRANARAAGVTNLIVEQAGFLTFEPAGPLVDAIYSRYALHHLPDFWKVVALERMHRVLRPGGIVRLWDVVYSFTATDWARRVEDWCAQGSTDVGSGWDRSELEEHIRDEHSTFTWLLEPMIERVGFTIDRAEYSGDAFSAKYVLTKR